MLFFFKNGIQLQRNFRVCHIVAAKWVVFHEKPKGYVNNPRNCRFPGLGNVESAFWGSGGASEVDRKRQRNRIVFWVPKTEPQGDSKSILTRPCRVFRGVLVFSKFFRFPKIRHLRSAQSDFDSAGPMFQALSRFFGGVNLGCFGKPKVAPARACAGFRTS